LPLPLVLVYAAQLRRSQSKALRVMVAFLGTGPLGVLFYNVLPACGPIHVFGSAFPFHPLSTAAALHMPLTAVAIPGARNAIPSLHMTWVLLIWWNSKGLSPWIRAIACTFVWATVLATMGTGEHYFIDLVVALPFSLLVQGLSSLSLPLRAGPRRVSILFGTFAMLLWLALLSFATRLFWTSPVLPWTMVAVTLGASLTLWRRLLDASTQETQSVLSLPAAQARARRAAG
ncbi:MAG: phosphatase PAP2 family protein, partial [Acidobacteria bacterium]|nr:phosphatase PAP2 family protein [Acidobacteriota bacterium]